MLAFAGACALGSICGFLQGAWSFGVVDGCSCLAQKTAEAAAESLTDLRMPAPAKHVVQPMSASGTKETCSMR